MQCLFVCRLNTGTSKIKMGLLQFSCAMVSLQRYVGYVIPKTMRKLELFYENSSNNLYRYLFEKKIQLLYLNQHQVGLRFCLDHCEVWMSTRDEVRSMSKKGLEETRPPVTPPLHRQVLRTVVCCPSVDSAFGKRQTISVADHEGNQTTLVIRI